MVKYKLYGNIGDKGSFGEVIRVRKVINNIEYEQEYALKILKSDDEEAKARFVREVMLLKDINHPRVIKILDYNLKSSTPFYVMPIYRTSLRSCINDIVGNWVKIKYIFNAMLDGVECLHKQGICHRDIKPENFLLNSYKDLVVSDLGLGLRVDEESTRMTMVGTTMGTICYMSPEQMMDSKGIDSRADIYSLGKVLYECITGQIPNNVDLNLVPNGMRYVISKCIAGYVHERFQTIDELRGVFNSSVDMLIVADKKEKIKGNINQLLVRGNNSSDIKELFGYMYKIDYKRELELVHDIVMRLSIDTIREFEAQYENNYVELMAAFGEYITKNAWEFEYTDKIATRCRDIYYSTDHLKVKSEMIFCLIKIGYYYDRPYVNKCAREMIYSIKDTDLACLVRWHIEKINKRIIIKLKLNKEELHPIIRAAIYTKKKQPVKKVQKQ